MAQGATPSIVRYLRTLGVKEALKDLADVALLERFAAGHDEAAFAVLVRRHGGMVLQVCRSLLPNHADADDAFQATFLALARQARSIRDRGSLGSWLYGVAYRTALKARAADATRRHHEARARAAARAEAADELTWREAQGILHQELARLPEKYRAPLVLCYLQGKRQDEAARLLAWPHGKLRSMLERARERLRRRLLLRGLGPSAALLTSVSLGQTLAAAPSGALLARAVHAATLATRLPVGGAVSAPVAGLVKRVARTLSVPKLAVACGGLLAVALGFGLRPGADPAAAAQDNALAGRVARPPHAPTEPARPRAVPPRKLKVSTRASGSWGEHTPDRAFDGTAHTLWNSGSYFPQWIEADLGAVTPLATLALVAAQTPAGETRHEVWVSDEPIGKDPTGAKLAHTFKGHTDNNQRLTLTFARGLSARHVQIRTVWSPSWVAWLEVELRVQGPDGPYLCRSDRTAVRDRRADPTRHLDKPGSVYLRFLPTEVVLPSPYHPGALPDRSAAKIGTGASPGPGPPGVQVLFPERPAGHFAPWFLAPSAPRWDPAPGANRLRASDRTKE
jgi:RNA polymerase sigma factor (sigma-70 family)